MSDLDHAGLFLDVLNRWGALVRSWKGKTPRALAEYKPSDRGSASWKQFLEAEAKKAREILDLIAEHGGAVVNLLSRQGDSERARLVWDWIDAQDKWEFDRWTRDVWDEVRGTVGYLVATNTAAPTGRSQPGVYPVLQDDHLNPPEDDQPQYVTLDMAAALIPRSKRTLQKAIGRKKNPLPDPDIQGTGGHPNEWKWTTIRPWLEQEYGRQLPERFPSLRN
ncbi:MAG TPA: hypothetical protein VH643_21105 [Gemmataceae bacterium]